MTDAAKKQELINAYQQAWKIEADAITAAVNDINWDAITDSNTADAAYEAIYAKTNRGTINYIRDAMSALEAVGVTNYTNDLNFIIDTPEFKSHGVAIDKLHAAENKIREIGRERLAISGKAAIKAMTKDTPIEEFAVAVFHSNGIQVRDTDGHIKRFIDNIRNKNVEAVASILRTKENYSSAAIFERMTGIKLHSTARETLKQLDQWAGISPEQRAEIIRQKDDARKHEETIRDLTYAWNALSGMRVRLPDGPVVDGRKAIELDYEEGFTSIVTEKIGAATRYMITNDNGSSRYIKDRQYSAFMKAANAFGGLEKALLQVSSEVVSKPSAGLKPR